MDASKKHTGVAVPLDRPNIDTDAIIPKQFLKRIERTGFGQFLFYDWRFKDDGSINPDFILNKEAFKDATILVARDNFGCGSSREHAPWSLLDYGFKVIIAPSFADIFYNNSLKNGILLIELPSDEVEGLIQRITNQPGLKLTADLTTNTVSDETGWQTSFNIDEYQRSLLLQGLDDIGITLLKEDFITAYEQKQVTGI
ncbi:MAG: 3-isopropylmalate dehydratase small subunit [Clostridiales bacterium]|nr:3-isopropylmalate dehydratase small subunit [Clostridiales bacterium]